MAEEGSNPSIDDAANSQWSETIEDQRTEGAKSDAQSAPAITEENEPGEPRYQVGYRRPPKATRIKPGERRNPRGRPPGSRNLKTIVNDSLTKKIPVRLGDKIKNVPRMEAITDTFAVKAAQGDAKAAAIVISLATKAGILDGRNGATENDGNATVVPTATGVRPSDALVESVDPNLLSMDEKTELSRFAERIDATGEVIGLSDDDFARLKSIVNKGREKNVAPRLDENLEQAT